MIRYGLELAQFLHTHRWPAAILGAIVVVMIVAAAPGAPPVSPPLSW